MFPSAFMKPSTFPKKRNKFNFQFKTLCTKKFELKKVVPWSPRVSKLVISKWRLKVRIFLAPTESCCWTFWHLFNCRFPVPNSSTHTYQTKKSKFKNKYNNQIYKQNCFNDFFFLIKNCPYSELLWPYSILFHRSLPIYLLQFLIEELGHVTLTKLHWDLKPDTTSQG